MLHLIKVKMKMMLRMKQVTMKKDMTVNKRDAKVAEDLDEHKTKILDYHQSCEMSEIWQIYLCKNIGWLGSKVQETTKFCKMK